jgi:hypothetical protein
VVLAREQEGAQHRLAVDVVGDLVGVLGDDREQVAEQLVLERRQVVGQRERAVVAVLGAVDRLVRGDRDRRRAVDQLRREMLAVAVQAAAAAARLGSLLIRYRRPSSRCRS